MTLAADGYVGVEVTVTDARTEVIIHVVRLKDVVGFKGFLARELSGLLQRRFRFRLPVVLFGLVASPSAVPRARRQRRQ